MIGRALGAVRNLIAISREQFMTLSTRGGYREALETV